MNTVFFEKLNTEHLELRKWNEKDADRLYHLASDSEIARWAGWLPHLDENYSKAIETVLNAISTVDPSIKEKVGKIYGI